MTTDSQDGGRVNGTVRRVVSDRGFAFLNGEDGQKYFLHRSDMAAGSSFQDLREVDPVSFEPVMPIPEKGPRARNVRAAAPAGGLS